MIDDEIELSTGKKLYANRNLVSLRLDGGVWELHEGYDSPILNKKFNYGLNCDEYQYTVDELKELADIIIFRWKQFKRDISTDKDKVR